MPPRTAAPLPPSLPPPPPPPPRHPTSYRDPALGLIALLFAFRLLNALTLRSFFQPDEFFQSLEPAWQLAFGPASNACITWEWTTHLRSSLHPALFAAVYRLAAQVADLGALTLPATAKLLLATPKLVQAVLAALLDGYTWKLAEKVHGRGTPAALAATALSIGSPWQWFCSTRTLSNCAETTLTAMAAYYWPWHWHAMAKHDLGSSSELRRSLLLAALACVLRPTNGLIWLCVGIPTLWQASKQRRHVLLREIFFCGSAVLACSAVSDRLYYRVWTLPPLRFLYFNIAQSMAVFYGKNRADYYFTEGLPLLLTTALPFALVGLWQSLRHAHVKSSPSAATSAPGQGGTQHHILTRLAHTSIFMTVVLSLISHKEVRFLYPILPFLHVLAAKPLSTFLVPPLPLTRKLTILTLLTANILLAGYASQVHQRGVIDVLSHLRHEHEVRNGFSTLPSPSTPSHITNTTVAFLMPCHSTPWRSHLIYPEITAWALTCDPPLNIPLAQRSTYRDEADEFYLPPSGPVTWLRANMEDVNTIRAGVGSRSARHWGDSLDHRHEGQLSHHHTAAGQKQRRAWPHHLVFFAQLQGSLTGYLEGSRYRECWRGFNSHFHDDWRRVGDVVVWCLDGE